ncbi:MAG: hypothetical protein PVH41_05965 [Anaerolineae bacterium]|jgi:hypothetical protein
MHKEDLRKLIRNFIIELVVYGALVAAYSYVVLRWLSEPLFEMFHTNLLLYALLSLGLIVAQGAILDFVTSFLLRLLPTHRRQ